jgi:hypothetical protein
MKRKGRDVTDSERGDYTPRFLRGSWREADGDDEDQPTGAQTLPRGIPVVFEPRHHPLDRLSLGFLEGLIRAQ